MEGDKLHLILDFDSTLIPTHLAVLDLYRKYTGDYGTEVDDRTVTWNMEEVCRQWTLEEINNVFCDPNLFEEMEKYVLSEDLAVLKLIRDIGYTIEICTIHRECGIKYKRAFLEKIYGDYVDKITIIEAPSEADIPVRMNKSFIKGDVIIDDSLGNLYSSPAFMKICFGDYTWNREWEGIRVGNLVSIIPLLKLYKRVQ